MATFVDAGIEYVAKLINGVSTDPFTYMAIGSGDTAEANGQTALVTEYVDFGLERVGATCAYEASGKATWSKEFTCANDGKTVNEVAILDAAAAGNMLMRHKFTSTKNLDTGDKLTISVTFTETRT